VELAAAVRGRVRKWPVLVVNTVLLVVAADLAGSLYLREAMGVKLLDGYRENLVPPSESVVTDSGGHRIGELAAADAVREPLDKVPTIFHDALIRWEDARFLAHDGVDRYRMAGAVAALLHGDPQGGSTLTMQLAKLIKKDSARTLRRKMEDIALALAMDSRLGKEEVLKDYANQAYFGSGVYGLGQACRYYFNRENCEGLRLEEAAYLVSLLRAPAELSRDPVRARARRNLVIDQMREPDPLALLSKVHPTAFDRFSTALYLRVHSFFDHEIAGRNDLQGAYSGKEINQAKQTPLALARERVPPTHAFVLETARRELQKKLGSGIYEDGYAVRLTIDSNVQKMAEHALGVGLDHLRQLRETRGEQTSDDLDGGVVVIDPRSGRMLAYVPGADFSTSQVPFAARPIQVGSALKPFIYGELLEQGKATLDTHFLDAPICFGGWCPKNYDNKYHGVVPVWFALSRSLNTVAVRVADTIGVDSIVARMRLLGVQAPLTANLPMALGASELSLLELGGMYSSLYDGRVVRPRLVLDVHDRNGNLVYGSEDPERPLAFQPSTIEQLHAAMALVLGPGGTAAPVGRELTTWFNIPKGQSIGETAGTSPQIACKTGTHTGFIRVGMGCLVSDTDYGPVIIVSYVGHRIPQSLGTGMTGGHIAGPIMTDLIESLTVKTRSAGVFRPFPKMDRSPAVAELAQRLGGGAGLEGALGPRLDQLPPPNPQVQASLTAKDRDDPLFPVRVAANQEASKKTPLAPMPTTVVASAAGTGIEESSAVKQLQIANLRLVAPRDWEGLQVLDGDTVEASGPLLVKSFLDAGGREQELTELAPYLGMTVENHVVHTHRLLAPGFADQPLAQRFYTLSDRVMASLSRMLSTKAPVTTYEHPDPLTHILSEGDADRRIERIYRFGAPIRMFRVTRHHTTGALLALQWVDGDGERHAIARENGHLETLTSHHVTVTRGSLEPAWIEGGMTPASLDTLRALIGGSIRIDRIPRGFKLQLLLADGSLEGVEAERPAEHVGDPPLHVSAVRTLNACLAQDGAPCSRRLLPLPLAEAHVYGHRAATENGTVLVQLDQAQSPAFAPATGRITVADTDRDYVSIDMGDGRSIRIEGVKPMLTVGQSVTIGEPIGRLDVRGVLVLRAEETQPWRTQNLQIDSVLPELNGADDSLRSVSTWWRELHAWLRGDLPETGHAAVAHRS
jgi:penicillin-binding protein 1A